jgi:tetratricopeptide (TPR) repeat protein/uncharacterized membrane protein YjjB (DUF3815 family)
MRLVQIGLAPHVMRRHWAMLTGAQALLALVCTQVPLCNVLGYEYALCATLLAALTTPHLGRLVAQRIKGPTYSLRVAWTLATTQWCLALPVMLACAGWVKNCNLGLGLAFFLTMPLASSWLGATLGWLVGVLSGHTPRTAQWATWVAQSACLGLGLARLYTEPPIFLFDPLLGYFSGSLYDEAIGMPTGLLAMRVTSCLLLVGVWRVACYLHTARRRDHMLAWVALAAAAVMSYGLEPLWGTRIDHRAVHLALPITRARPGLQVHLAQETPDDVADRTADDAAFRMRQLTARMHLDFQGLIHVYVYRSAAHKAQWMGGANTMVAKPWLQEVHIHGTDFPHLLLAHELAHALAAAWAKPPLYVSAYGRLGVAMGLVEGLAVALTPDTDAVGLMASAQSLYDLHLAVPLQKLLTGPLSFWRLAPARAYTQAGAFLRFIEERYGVGAVADIYRTRSVEHATKKTLALLEQEFEHMLALTPREKKAEPLARQALIPTSIFKKQCAHELARLRVQAAGLPPERAESLWRQVVVDSGGALTDRFSLARTLYREKKYQQASAIISQITNQTSDVAFASLLWSWQAFIAYAQDDLSRAQSACAQAQHLKTGDAPDRLAYVIGWALQQQEPYRAVLMKMLSGNAPCTETSWALMGIGKEDATARYLMGRALEAEGAYKAASERLQIHTPHPFGPIETERLRLLTLSHVHVGNYPAALTTASTMLATAGLPGHAAWAQDMVARIVFLQNQKSR